MNPAEAMARTEKELERARGVHAPFNSAHEGIAVIAEEVDELWTEVKKRPCRRDREMLRDEAVQVAAMALRFLVDCC